MKGTECYKIKTTTKQTASTSKGVVSTQCMCITVQIKTTKVSCGKLFHTFKKCYPHKHFNILASRIAAMPLGNFYCPSEFLTSFSFCSSHTHRQPYFSAISTAPQLSLLPPAFSTTPQVSQPSRFATMQNDRDWLSRNHMSHFLKKC